MSNRRIRLAICCVLGATGIALGPGRAVATQKFGPIQLSGNLQSQNLIRTPNESTFEYIQNRNTAHIRLDYDWLQGGLFYNKYNIPFLESSHLFVLWRGVYDSIYDTTPGFFEKEDAHGKAYPGLPTPTSSSAPSRSPFAPVASRSSGARATTSACSTA